MERQQPTRVSGKGQEYRQAPPSNRAERAEIEIDAGPQRKGKRQGADPVNRFRGAKQAFGGGAVKRLSTSGKVERLG